jgi:hypothetical protein
VKLLVDEMWPPMIAEQLRRRGHDVVAVAERLDLRSKGDSTVFNAAQAEARVVVSEDIRGFRALARLVLESGGSHAGLIFTSNASFPRGRGRAFGSLIVSLHELLLSDSDLTDCEHWL